MLGYSHAISGALGWLLMAPPAFELAHHPLPIGAVAAGALACAGAATIPDIDHPQATIAYTFGPVSHSVAKVVRTLSGGHRMGTHSLIFAAGAGVVTELAILTGWKPAAWIIMFLLSAFAIRGLNLVPPTRSNFMKSVAVIVLAGLLTWVLTLFPAFPWLWLGPAVFAGCIIHCLGDSLTPQRVPWLWPKRTRYGIAIGGKSPIEVTGNTTETKIITPIMTVALVVMIWFTIVNPLLKNMG